MKIDPRVEKFRIRTGPYGSSPGDKHGAFLLPGPFNMTLRVLASEGDAALGVEWEHVSVSLSKRCPNWPEMCYVKDLFWDESECVMQLHPPRSEYVNNHDFCLHLWKPRNTAIPMPPRIAV